MITDIRSSWRFPGCGDLCSPRSHDPIQHEWFGRQRALVEAPLRVVRTGPLTVDLNARTVAVNGEDVTLSGREWGVLAYLAGHVGQWCAHDEIVASAWGPEWVGGDRYRGGQRATYGLLGTAIDRLRKKLGPAGRLVTSIPHRNRCVRRLELEAPL